MNEHPDYVGIAEKLQLALRVALISGKFPDGVKQYLSRVDREAEEILGKLNRGLKLPIDRR